MVKYLTKLLQGVCVGVPVAAISQGVVLYFGLGDWVRNVLKNIGGVSFNPEIAGWILSGVIGLVFAVLWLAFDVGGRLRKRFQKTEQQVETNSDVFPFNGEEFPEGYKPDFLVEDPATDPNWITLTTAGAALYNQFNADIKGTIAKNSEKYLSITEHCISIVVDAAKNGVVELYGRREHGLSHEKISCSDLDALYYNHKNGLSEVGENKSKWFDVRLRATDISRVILSVECGDLGYNYSWYALWGAINWFDDNATAKLKTYWRRASTTNNVSYARTIGQSILKLATAKTHRIFSYELNGKPKIINSSDPMTIAACFDEIENKGDTYYIRNTDMQSFLDAFESEARRN